MIMVIVISDTDDEVNVDIDDIIHSNIIVIL